MIGAEQIEALRHSHVMVVGVGGVGGGTVEALSRAGVGTLTLVDRDVVDITNMNRQVAALSSTVGMPKVEALAVRVRDVNPECDVRLLCVNLAADTVDELLSDRPDCVADCIDDMNAKVLLICECKRRGIPIVSSMGAGNRLDPSGPRTIPSQESCASVCATRGSKIFASAPAANCRKNAASRRRRVGFPLQARRSCRRSRE